MPNYYLLYSSQTFKIVEKIEIFLQISLFMQRQRERSESSGWG